MKKAISAFCAAVMALSVPMATPAAAGMPTYNPAFSAPQSSANANLIEVQQFRDVQIRRDRGQYRRDRGRDRGFERRGDRAYYRGHRGYRQARPGYRQHQGWWFPSAAFIAGAIIGGAAQAQPPVRYRPRGGANAHVQWCYDRYRSYRASDNTFQPYNGPRRQCRSPYG